MTDIITDIDKFNAAERELKMRRRVYPRWVEEGKLSEGRATHEIACMEAIAEDYRARAAKERLL